MTRQRYFYLLEKEIPSLKKSALFYYPDIEDAEDLLQDTLVHLIEKMQYYQEGNFGGWSRTILHNLYCNRKRQNDPFVYVNMWDLCNLDDDTQYASCDIDIAMSTLPQAYLSTMRLYLEGYKYDEIARILNTAEGTVKSRIHRGKRHLQHILWAYQ